MEGILSQNHRHLKAITPNNIFKYNKLFIFFNHLFVNGLFIAKRENQKKKIQTKRRNNMVKYRIPKLHEFIQDFEFEYKQGQYTITNFISIY